MPVESMLLGLASWLTHLGSLSLLTVALVLFLAAGGARAVIGRAAAALFAATAASHLLKLTLDVPRPDPAFAHIAVPLDASFPSGHTAQAAAVCWTWLIVAGREDRRLLEGALVVATIGLVAWSRVALGVHRVEDVVGGAALGILTAIGAAALAPARGGGRW